MPRMIDLIRASQVPSNLMQSAARGALSVPADENIEILVYLAHHKLFGQQARMTLAGWDEVACAHAAANPKTSAEVLGYFISPENLRIPLLPTLAENLSVTEEALDSLAVSGSRAVVEVLLQSRRVQDSPRLLQALQTNPNLRANELAEIAKKLNVPEASPAVESSEAVEEGPDAILEEAVTKYLQENAAEIAAELAAEKNKPFQVIGMGVDDVFGEAETPIPAPSEAPVAPPAEPAAATPAPAPAAAHAKKHIVPGHEEKRDSVLQKIAKLNIQGRIALAMRGNKEERSILIRDSTKLVCLAVLDSPKVSDGEVEKFALQKNVLEAVLRGIPMRRKYAKNYSIMRNLVFNPRTPLDLSLGLMKNLLVHDLKNLSGNKEVSETVRKLALRMFKQKIEKKD